MQYGAGQSRRGAKARILSKQSHGNPDFNQDRNPNHNNAQSHQDRSI